MKTSIITSLRRAVAAFLIALAALAVFPGTAQAQLYVTQLIGLGPAGKVSQYNLSGGGSPKPDFIVNPSIQGPCGIAIMGNTLFVANQANNTVGAYNANTGAPSNLDPTVIGPFDKDKNPNGVAKPTGLAVMGNTLYVSNNNNGNVGAYNITTGQGGVLIVTAINAKFIAGQKDNPNGLVRPAGMAIANNVLFVASSGSGLSAGVIGTYNPSSGAPIDPNFINTMLNVPGGLVIQGNTLYVSNQGSNTVSVYTLNFGTPGTVAGATLARSITGLNIPTGLAFQNGTLFVANAMSGTIGAYGNGAPKTNPSFIIGLTLPAGLAVKSN